jgi:hypothetical protein
MPKFPDNVNQKNLERRLGALFRARSLRREMELPTLDLEFKIWLTKRRLLRCWRKEK